MARPRTRQTAVRSGIRFWREQRGISQMELAGAAQLQRPEELSRYENGVALPNLDEVTRIAAALKVSLGDLYSDEVLRVLRGAQEVA